jgi:hypothetical protein
MKTVKTVKTVCTAVRLCICAAVLATLPPGRLAAQDVRARLEARGLPADLVQQVTLIAADATAQGLPTAPLADKAIEGFAKQIPAPRIIAAVRQFSARMLDARSAVHDAGVAAPPGDMVTAAAEAMGRGFQASDVGHVVRAAPRAELAASGLTVAAALTAQGMTTPRAVEVVTSALKGGNSSAQILDLPSAVRAMQSNGLTADEAGQQMLRGGPPGDGGRSGGPGPNGGQPGGGAGGDGRGPGLGGDGRGPGSGGGSHGPGPGGGTPPPPPRGGRPPDGGHSGPGGGQPGRP